MPLEDDLEQMKMKMAFCGSYLKLSYGRMVTLRSDACRGTLKRLFQSLLGGSSSAGGGSSAVDGDNPTVI
ncbi:unnamed protein product [Heligmosomoides polygyrus]|uniref:Rad51 domain-containing protein n=1 Tax=Heligmosomoides polygyrus TaxID=6339 RepID=A0A183F7V3_HELPZ|nr:unnamed protein product [Heligmosomoides polygyrus]